MAIVAHHLVMDGVSQRILVDDLSSAYADGRGSRRKEMLPLVYTSSTFRDWCYFASARVVPAIAANSQGSGGEEETSLAWPGGVSLATKAITAANTEGAAEAVLIEFSKDETAAILSFISGGGGGGGGGLLARYAANEVFLGALALAHLQATGEAQLEVDLEGLGRDAWVDVLVEEEWRGERRCRRRRRRAV